VNGQGEVKRAGEGNVEEERRRWWRWCYSQFGNESLVLLQKICFSLNVGQMSEILSEIW